MKIFPSLDSRDRKAVLICLSLVAVAIVLIAMFAPRQRDESPVPSSYGVGTHGAKAAYLLLVRSGYNVERWEQPLSSLVDSVDEHTVIILADPFRIDPIQTKVDIKNVLAHGGRVLAIGYQGAGMLPDGQPHVNDARIGSTACQPSPDGFDPLASSGEIHMDAYVVWAPIQPGQRVQYRCGDGAVVVTYPSGKGTITWWASSMPLENASILRGNNLDLFLNSVGPPEGARVVWDESLHGDVRSLSSYTAGTPVGLMWMQAALVAALLLFSLSRRSGPLRPFVETPRTTPLEFVESLGALYDRSGAANTAVVIAYERFRRQLEKRGGFAPADTRLPAAELAEAIQTRLHYNHPQLGADLAASEAASYTELSRRAALTLAQALHDHSERLALTEPTFSSSINTKI